MKTIMVKKMMPDGSACPKCQQVQQILESRGYLDKIDRIVMASPKEPNGEGMQLVKRHKMKLAPFFVVEKDDGEASVYTSYITFIKEVLEPGAVER